MIKHTFLSLSVLFLLLACRNEEFSPYSAEDAPGFFKPYEAVFAISSDSIKSIIHAQNEQLADTALWVHTLKHYYAQSYEFLWLREGGLKQLKVLMAWIADADRHGVDREMFCFSSLTEIIRLIEEKGSLTPQNVNEKLAHLELLATQAYMRYTCGLPFGFVDPHRFIDDIPATTPDGEKQDRSRFLYHIPLLYCDSLYAGEMMTALKSGTAVSMLTLVQPQDTFYIRMQKELFHYLPIANMLFDTIPFLGETLLAIGDRHEAVSRIAGRLKLTGEFQPVNDSISDELTPELLEAVNRFRRKNRLPEDKTIGAFTVRYLNRPISFYTERLRVNLERARWKYQQKYGEKYILVNAAAFMLKAVDETAATIIEMRICCGGVKHRTPLLASKITYMEFNPYWNVPHSIIRKEIIPAYTRDTTYFTRNRMKVYNSSGKLLNPHEIKWSNYRNHVPFTVKQDNGQGNSLGRIIFRFPNTFAVYLHDTPSIAPFSRVNRAVSHGCVRLERAMDFAFFLLEEPDEVMEDRIRVAMGKPALSEKGKKLVQEEEYKDLEKKTLIAGVPLFIDYQTMYLSPEGELSFCEDAYGYDPVLLTAIEQLKTYDKDSY